MNGVLDGAALLVGVLAVVCGAGALVTTRDARLSLHVLLELLLAAGLLRLATEPSWRQIVEVALLVSLRRLLSWAFDASSRAAAAGRA